MPHAAQKNKLLGLEPGLGAPKTTIERNTAARSAYSSPLSATVIHGGEDLLLGAVPHFWRSTFRLSCSYMELSSQKGARLRGTITGKYPSLRSFYFFYASSTMANYRKRIKILSFTPTHELVTISLSKLDARSDDEIITTLLQFQPTISERNIWTIGDTGFC